MSTSLSRTRSSLRSAAAAAVVVLATLATVPAATTASAAPSAGSSSRLMAVAKAKPQAVSSKAAACARPTLTKFVAVMNELDDLSMANFLSRKTNKSPCWIDWSDDGCSFSPDSGTNYNFLKSCKRHDFGYRNSKRAESWYGKNMWRLDNKAVADTSFKRDMTNHCMARSDESTIGMCLDWRTKYYNIVAGISPSTTGISKSKYTIP